MGAHRGLRTVGICPADGLQHVVQFVVTVLAVLGRFGHPDQGNLHLGVQPLDQRRQRRVTAGPRQQRVEPGVGVGIALTISPPDRSILNIESGVQLLGQPRG